MERWTPYAEVDADGRTTWVVQTSFGTTSRLPFEARTVGRVAYTRITLADGSAAAEIHWPDVLAEGLTLPPGPGTWRRDRDKGWVAHDPADPAQTALLVQQVADHPEVVARRLAAAEAKLAAVQPPKAVGG